MSNAIKPFPPLLRLVTNNTEIMEEKQNEQSPMADTKREDAEPTFEHAEAVTSNELPLWQALRKWRRVTIYCIGLTSAILMYGYDYVIVGTTSSMPSFQEDFGEKYNGKWILPSLWLGLWNFASPGASMIGAVIGGSFQDWVGRRSSLAVGSFLSAIGVAILFVSNKSDDIHVRRVIFLVGKAFQGGAIGIVMATTQTYMSEVLPPVLRGSILAFFSVFTLLGQLIGAGVIYACLGISDGYTICFATQWPLSVVPFVVALIIPESPTYLIRKGRLVEALKAQRRLDSPGMDSEKNVELIRRNIESERERTRATYRDCFQGTNLRRTLIVIFANLLPNIFGLTLLAKASYFAQVVGMRANLSLMILVIGIFCGFLANLASIWILSRVGRRPLIIVTLSILSLLWLSMGISGFWSGQPTVWYTAIVLIFIIMVAGLGVWPCSYAISGETSSLELRAKTQGIGWLVAGAATSLFGFVLPYIFNTDQGNLGAKTGFVYTGLCTIGLVVSFFYIPEMKGRAISEIDQMFEERIDARQFKSWRSPTT